MEVLPVNELIILVLYLVTFVYIFDNWIFCDFNEIKEIDVSYIFQMNLFIDSYKF